MARKALIIVDMLNDFIDEKGTLYCGKEAGEIIPSIKKRLKTFRERKDLVIHVQDSHDENDREFARFAQHGVVGTWGHSIIKELTPEPGETVIPKKTLNAFYGTDLESVLENAGIDDVEIVGVCTSICVMDAVGDLTNRGYKVLVPVKEVADFDQEAHTFALRRMKQVYGADVL